ncbi:hypothetical protein FACS189426_07670 [Bacteroidia bacterium]|nr:hypothetical protein FACS189426_07670 [Bacteroidia bacterium]GHT84185.1 hypothetical protein FACS18947_1280 [Bacteroidia bacterium]
MKKIILITLYLSFSFIIHAQEIQYIIGAVYDKASGEILVSASVYYDKNQKVTITNAEGEYQIEKIADADSLNFSYIGYATKKYNINNIPQKIYLEPAMTNLAEVVVTPFDVNKFVKQVWNRYNEIYLKESTNKDNLSLFFYRQISQTDTIYNEFIETFFTAANTYCVGNHFVFREGRYAKIKSDSVYLFSGTNFFVVSRISPFSSINPSQKKSNTFLQPNFETIYEIKIDNRFFSEENGDIIVLDFVPKPKSKEKLTLLSGKLYIRESDLSIVRMEGVSNQKIKASGIKNQSLSFSVNYRDGLNGYPQVETVKIETDYNFIIKKKTHKAHIVSTLFAVDQYYNPSDNTRKSETLNLVEIIDKMKYHPEFWRNNPIVKRTAVDEKIIKSFENSNAFGTFKGE